MGPEKNKLTPFYIFRYINHASLKHVEADKNLVELEVQQLAYEGRSTPAISGQVKASKSCYCVFTGL